MAIKKVKHPKMDQHLISNQKWEIEYVVSKLKNEGITVTAEQVKVAVKKCNNSRRKTYGVLRILNS